MKQIFTPLACLSVLLLAMPSCRKEAQHENRQQFDPAQTVQANVSAGQTYVLSMGTGSTAIIKQQASHYELSQVATAEDGNAVYKYAAVKGYTGTDEVTLQQTTTSTSHGGGCSNNHDSYATTSIKTVVVKFAVAN